MADPYILSIHLGHDAGAAITKGFKILAAVNEERYMRIKHYVTFPINSVNYCLQYANIDFDDIDALALSSRDPPNSYKPYIKFNDKVVKKFENVEQEKFYSYYSGPTNLIRKEFNRILGRVLNVRVARKARKIRRSKVKTTTAAPWYIEPFEVDYKIPIFLINHHLAHAASAYFTSGFGSDNLIITADGIGGNISTAVWQAVDGQIRPLITYGKEGSLGWFYGLITEAMGWWHGDGEGKTMGLAAYGDPKPARNDLIRILPYYKNGYLERPYNYSLPTQWFIRNTYHWHFRESDFIHQLLSKYKREDIAAACQDLLEESMMGLISPWVKKLDVRNVCGAGGVFLNVKMNQKIFETLKLENLHIFPSAGDGGLAVGAALQAYSKMNSRAKYNPISDVYLGPSFTDDEIESILETRKLKYEKINKVAEECAEQLSKGKIIGWFQGRMELGPRALGNRSILIDPRKQENKDIINNNVKFREPWRPFCPSLLEEKASDYFLNARKAPYMIVSFDVKPEKKKEIPAVVHVDGTARPQTVAKDVNPVYYKLIESFGEQTSVPVILNTSFNIRGNPIICTPIDAIECFFNTGIDTLAINNFLIEK